MATVNCRQLWEWWCQDCHYNARRIQLECLKFSHAGLCLEPSPLKAALCKSSWIIITLQNETHLNFLNSGRILEFLPVPKWKRAVRTVFGTAWQEEEIMFVSSWWHGYSERECRRRWKLKELCSVFISASLWAPKETCSTVWGWLVHQAGKRCLCRNFGLWYSVVIGGQLLPWHSAPESGVQVTLVWWNSLRFLVLKVRAQSMWSRGSGIKWVLVSVCVPNALSSVFQRWPPISHIEEGELLLTRALECRCCELQLTFLLGELRSCRGWCWVWGTRL